MNSKEIKEALKIINEPITVNCIEYKYFDEENYNKITNVYENCLWFANNLEQINLTVENLQKENQKLKDEIYKSNAVADTNIELAESYYKEIERLKGLLKCDYEDGQTIIAELTTENKQLKENNLAMQEEMDRTWAKLQQKEDIINKANNFIENGDLIYLASKCSTIYSGNIEVKAIYDRLKELLEILDNKGE